MKKARSFTIQKLVKKLKASETYLIFARRIDFIREIKKEKVAETMKQVKGIDCATLASYLADNLVLGCNSEIVECLAVAKVNSDSMDAMLALLECKALETARLAFAAALESTFKNIFHRTAQPQKEVTEKPKDGEGPLKVKEKRGKNRLGQQARRQQWEKVYGEEAKHLKAVSDLKDEVLPSRTTIKEGLRASAENDSLHPSWEAKRKEKELSRQKPSGQRIVFDD